MKNKALILDFGGVISRTLFETHSLTEQALGLSANSLLWHGPFDPTSDPLWQSMLANEISERDYWQIRTQEVAAMIGANWQQMSDFVQAARGANAAQVIRPEFHQAFATARAAGCRVAILSNELDLFYGAQFRTNLPFMSDMDLIHDATYTQTLKPEPTAYINLLKELGLQASDCVFVDDQPRNIQGADAVGLQTVLFDVRNPQESYDAACQLLGLSQDLGAQP